MKNIYFIADDFNINKIDFNKSKVIYINPTTLFGFLNGRLTREEWDLLISEVLLYLSDNLEDYSIATSTSLFIDNRNIIEHISEMGKHVVICYAHEDIVPEILYKLMKSDYKDLLEGSEEYQNKYLELEKKIEESADSIKLDNVEVVRVKSESDIQYQFNKES